LKHCAPLDTSFNEVSFSIPWHERIERLRSSAPPEVRPRLNQFSVPDTPNKEERLDDGLLAAVVPANSPIPEPFRDEVTFPDIAGPLADVPRMESNPYLAHSVAERLSIGLMSIDLLSEFPEEGKGTER
jgi:hypothetical protein